MKTLFYSFLGLLVVGIISGAFAEGRLYFIADFEDVPLKKCWEIMSGNEPSKFIRTEINGAETSEFYLVKDKVSKFSSLRTLTPEIANSISLYCDVGSYSTSGK